MERAGKATGLFRHVLDNLGVGPGPLAQAGERDFRGRLRWFRDGGEGRDGGLRRGAHDDGAEGLIGHDTLPDAAEDLWVKGLERELGVELTGFHDRLPPYMDLDSPHTMHRGGGRVRG